MPFAYSERLGSQELRLLRPIYASQQVLRFDILKTSRSGAPPYTAVSYTWGDDEPSEIISLGGQPFHVRPNLWSCLYYLSLAKQGAGWSHLWVDAICINQEDDAERNVQVGAMDTTYSNAACVSVWLGLPPLPDAYQHLLRRDVPTKTLEIDPIDWHLWLPNLANRPYWSRFWVIQEFLLGAHVEVYCGNSKIMWQDFQEMVCRLAGVIAYGDSNIRSETLDSYRALPLVMGRHPDKHPQFLQPLQDLLITHSRAECKDPRDRVFALLGLVTREERNFLDRLFPNYKITGEQVAIMTLAHIQFFNNLNNGRKIDIESEVFLGLRVDSRTQRKRLLRQANELDYIGMETIEQVLCSLEFHDELRSLTREIEPSWDFLESSLEEPARRGSGTMVLSTLACLGVMGFMIFLSRR